MALQISIHVQVGDKEIQFGGGLEQLAGDMDEVLTVHSSFEVKLQRVQQFNFHASSPLFSWSRHLVVFFFFCAHV